MQQISNMKRSSQVAILLATFILIACCYSYWQHVIHCPSTDDAYLSANVINLAPQVSGTVNHVYIKDHQFVKSNTLLFSIDPTSYEIEVQAAQAQLDLAQQKAGTNIDSVDIAKAQVVERQAEANFAKQNSERILKLASQGVVSRANADEAIQKMRTATANLAAANSQLEFAQHQLGRLGLANAEVRLALARLAQAQLNLQHTKIFAPADGKIINFNLRTGTTVNSGAELFSLVEQAEWWVNANYKETDLSRIHVGQPVKITVDIYPQHEFKGIVEEISAGSGAAFAVLPPENATGNWVKVVQRIPVRIKILGYDPRYPLRVGASCSVEIIT